MKMSVMMAPACTPGIMEKRQLNIRRNQRLISSGNFSILETRGPKIMKKGRKRATLPTIPSFCYSIENILGMEREMNSKAAILLSEPVHFPSGKVAPNRLTKV
jgi:hypothetical protein